MELLFALFLTGLLVTFVALLAAMDGPQYRSVAFLFFFLGAFIFIASIVTALTSARNGHSTESLSPGAYTVLSVGQTEKTVLVVLAADEKKKMGSGMLFEVPKEIFDPATVITAPPSPEHKGILMVRESAGMKVLQFEWVLLEKH